MNATPKILCIAIIAAFLLNCAAVSQEKLIGKWQRSDDKGQVVTKPVKISPMVTIDPGTIEFKADGTYLITLNPNGGAYTSRGTYKVLTGSTVSMSSVDPNGGNLENIWEVGISGDRLTARVKGSEYSMDYKKMGN